LNDSRKLEKILQPAINTTNLDSKTGSTNVRVDGIYCLLSSHFIFLLKPGKLMYTNGKG